MSDSQADVVIIGGGIIGCTTAYYLAKRGVGVALVEKGEIAGEQSSRNWGFVRQQRRDVEELPLMMAANAIWRGVEAELEADVEWVQHGVLAAAGDEKTLARFRDWVSVSTAHGLETQLLSRAEIQKLVPKMTGHFLGGIYTPGDGHADPGKATRAFAEAARRHGARILTYHIAQDIETAGGQVTGVVTDRGTLRAPIVVNAAGAHASRVARMVGLRLPQLLVRSTVAETTPVEPITAAGVWAPDVSFRQRRDGRLTIARGGHSDFDVSLDSFRHMRQFLPNYLKNRGLFSLRIGSTLWNDVAALLPNSDARQHPFANTVGIEPPPNNASARRSLEHLVRLIPSAGDARISRIWGGVIDTTPDALPVLGHVDAPRGFVFATGFSGHGFGIGPAIGKVMAEMIAGEQPSIDVAHLDFGRFREGRTGKARSAV